MTMKVIFPDETSKTAPSASVQKNPDPECFVVGRKIILSIIRKKKHESNISTMYDIHVESMHVVVYEGWTTSNPIYEPPTLNKKKKNEKEGLSYTFFVGKKNGCGYMECWNRIKGGWDVFTCFDSTPQKIFDAKLDLYDDSIENLNMVYDHDMFKMDKRRLNPYASEDFIHHQIVANVQTDCDKIHGLVFSKVDKDSKVITTSSRKSEIGSLLAHADEKVLLTRMREPTLLFLLDSVSRDFVPSEDLVFFRMNIASIVFISLWCACIFPYSLKRELCDKSSLLLTTLFMENDMCELAHSCIDRVKRDMKVSNKMITQEYQFTMLRPIILVGEGIISDLYSGEDMVSFEKILLMKRLFLQLSRSKVDPYPYITMILKGRDAFSCLGVNWVRDEDRCACCNKSSSNVISLLNHDSRICNMCEQSTCDSCMRGSMCRICLEPAVGVIESCLLKEEVQTLEKEKSSIDLSKKLFVKEREKNFNLQKDLEECRRTSISVTLELETMQERLERIMKEQKSNLKQGERMKKMESENARLKKEFHIMQEENCKNKKRLCDEKVLYRDEIQTWKKKFEECERRLIQEEEEMKKSELMAVSFKAQLDTSLIDFQEEENKLLQRCVMEKKKVTSLEKKIVLMEKEMKQLEKKSNHNNSQGKEMDVLIQVFQSTLKNIDEPDAELWRRRYEELYYSVKRRDPSFFQN